MVSLQGGGGHHHQRTRSQSPQPPLLSSFSSTTTATSHSSPDKKRATTTNLSGGATGITRHGSLKAASSSSSSHSLSHSDTSSTHRGLSSHASAPSLNQQHQQQHSPSYREKGASILKKRSSSPIAARAAQGSLPASTLPSPSASLRFLDYFLPPSTASYAPAPTATQPLTPPLHSPLASNGTPSSLVSSTSSQYHHSLHVPSLNNNLHAKTPSPSPSSSSTTSSNISHSSSSSSSSSISTPTTTATSTTTTTATATTHQHPTPRSVSPSPSVSSTSSSHTARPSSPSFSSTAHTASSSTSSTKTHPFGWLFRSKKPVDKNPSSSSSSSPIGSSASESTQEPSSSSTMDSVVARNTMENARSGTAILSSLRMYLADAAVEEEEEEESMIPVPIVGVAPAAEHSKTHPSTTPPSAIIPDQPSPAPSAGVLRKLDVDKIDGIRRPSPGPLLKPPAPGCVEALVGPGSLLLAQNFGDEDDDDVDDDDQEEDEDLGRSGVGMPVASRVGLEAVGIAFGLNGGNGGVDVGEMVRLESVARPCSPSSSMAVVIGDGDSYLERGSMREGSVRSGKSGLSEGEKEEGLEDEDEDENAEVCKDAEEERRQRERRRRRRRRRMDDGKSLSSPTSKTLSTSESSSNLSTSSSDAESFVTAIDKESPSESSQEDDTYHGYRGYYGRRREDSDAAQVAYDARRMQAIKALKHEEEPIVEVVVEVVVETTADPFALLLGPPEVKTHSPLRPSLRRKRSVPLGDDTTEEVTATMTTPTSIPAPPTTTPGRQPSPTSISSTSSTSSTTAVNPSPPRIRPVLSTPSTTPRPLLPSLRRPSPRLSSRTRIMWADETGGVLEVHHDFSDYLDRVEAHRERRRESLLRRKEKEEEIRKGKGFFEILSLNPAPMYAFG